MSRRNCNGSGKAARAWDSLRSFTGRRRTRERLAWGVAAVCALTAVTFAVGWVRRAPGEPPLVRFTMAAPDGVTSVARPRSLRMAG